MNTPDHEYESETDDCDDTRRWRSQYEAKPQYPAIQKHADGGYVWTDCPECGPDVAIDEEGLCLGCGADAIHYGHEESKVVIVEIFGPDHPVFLGGVCVRRVGGGTVPLGLYRRIEGGE